MRRKTIAKRLLDLEYEDEEEVEDEEQKEYFGTPSSQSLCPRQAKRRTRTHPTNGEVNGIAPCHQVNGGLQKLDNMLPETDRPTAQHTPDGDCTTESFGSLQSRSKAELVAMVLSMQREMDSLREQVRCLTASGKLARTLESLIERTEQWSSSSGNRTTTPITPSGRTLAPAGRGQRTKVEEYSFYHQQQDGNCRYQQLPKETQNGGSHLPTPPLYQEFITAELLERCNTGTTAQKLTNDLLTGLYERDCLASHSISGIINSKRGQPKPALPAEEIQAILRAVQHYFPGKTDSEIKGYIRQKLQNESKRLRKKPHLLTPKEEEPGAQGEESNTHI